jgi:CheY-like chemotaxis protein
MAAVLILEDDRINLDVLGAVLRSHRYDVMQARTAEEAIDLSKERSHIDLLICDIAVGASSGTEVALQVCGIHPDVPVLFISGTAMYAWEKRDVNNFLKLPLDSVDCGKAIPPDCSTGEGERTPGKARSTATGPNCG